MASSPPRSLLAVGEDPTKNEEAVRLEAYIVKQSGRTLTITSNFLVKNRTESQLVSSVQARLRRDEPDEPDGGPHARVA